MTLTMNFIVQVCRSGSSDDAVGIGISSGSISSPNVDGTRYNFALCGTRSDIGGAKISSTGCVHSAGSSVLEMRCI
jgi:hypothetical protein